MDTPLTSMTFDMEIFALLFVKERHAHAVLNVKSGN